MVANPPSSTDRRTELSRRYQDFQAQKLSLDITRGKPSAQQLDLSLGLLECVGPKDFKAADGTDCRNYGGLDGLPEAKRLFADYMGVSPDEIIVSGNSSLNLMFDTFMRAMVKGVEPDCPAWHKLATVRFLCPSPGYDRHFSICEHLGIEMIPVAMTDSGPDMDEVERLARADEAIKGIWCVPCYSNPTGIVYSDEVVQRLAAMPTKARDFKIFWDNAYAVHHLTETPAPLTNILSACKHAGHPERVFMFGSTSKISFAGSGLAFMAGSRHSMDVVRRHLFVQTIGPDKLDQLRHVRFFKDMAGIEAQMEKHAALLRPKFKVVEQVLSRELGADGPAVWSRPAGGYFISLDVPTGCARRVVQLAAEAGVKLTPAGSTYPLGHDPQDRNIRIAPSFPPLEDIRVAMEVLAVSIQLAAGDRPGLGGQTV